MPHPLFPLWFDGRLPGSPWAPRRDIREPWGDERPRARAKPAPTRRADGRSGAAVVDDVRAVDV